MQGLNLGEANFICDFLDFPFGVNKEVVGIHFLLTRSLFACDILRRLLPRVSLAKPLSAPLRFLWLPEMKPQFGCRLHPWPRGTLPGAGAVRHSIYPLRI